MTTVQDDATTTPILVQGSGGEGDDVTGETPHERQPPRKRRTGPRQPLPRSTAVLLWVAAMSSLLALWVVAFALVLSSLQEHATQGRLYDTFREELAGGPTPPPLGGAIDPGTPVALLQVPAIGLSQVVVEGTSSQQLTAGPGHRRDTPLPGQAGVSVVLGRSVTFGAPFARVTQLRAGATIVAVTGQGTFHYAVSGVRRPGDPLPPPVASGAGRLTLVTVEGSGWRRGWAPQRVVYVDATLVGGAQPAPAGRPSAVAPDEGPLQVDTANLATLVLWLQALVLAVGAAAWAAVRWGGRQTWIVGAPLVLAALWGATEVAFVLVPNLL